MVRTYTCGIYQVLRNKVGDGAPQNRSLAVLSGLYCFFIDLKNVSVNNLMSSMNVPAWFLKCIV